MAAQVTRKALEGLALTGSGESEAFFRACRRLTLRAAPVDGWRSAAWGFDTGEPARAAAHQTLERLLPAGRFFAVTCGNCMSACLHTPIPNGGRIHVPTGRIAVRWERRTELHDAFISLACSLICWRRLKKARL